MACLAKGSRRDVGNLADGGAGCTRRRDCGESRRARGEAGDGRLEESRSGRACLTVDWRLSTGRFTAPHVPAAPRQASCLGRPRSTRVVGNNGDGDSCGDASCCRASSVSPLQGSVALGDCGAEGLRPEWH